MKNVNMNMLNQYKTTAFIILGTIAVVVIAFIIGKKVAPKINPAPLPNDDPTGTLSEAEKERAEKFAERLHEELDGMSASYDVKLFEDYGVMGDKMFVAVYNEYNKEYADGTISLKKRIEDEVMWDWWSIKDDVSIRDAKKTIMRKFEKLNLD